MTKAPAAIFKIPTKSPQPARGMASRARKAAAAQPKAARRAAGPVAGADLIAWYLNPDGFPVEDRWSSTRGVLDRSEHRPAHTRFEVTSSASVRYVTVLESVK